MWRRIVSERVLCEFTGLWYDETRYYLNDDEVTREEFVNTFPPNRGV